MSGEMNMSKGKQLKVNRITINTDNNAGRVWFKETYNWVFNSSYEDYKIEQQLYKD